MASTTSSAVGVTGGRMRGDDRLPPLADLVLVALEQSRLPDQPDCQKVGNGRIAAAAEFRLPEPIARVLRPAAQGHQHLVEIGF